MGGRRITSLIIAASVAAATVSITSWVGVSAGPSAVRLHLGTDAQQFSFGTTVQPLTVGKNSCAINSPTAGPLMVLSSGPNRSAPGLSNYGLGVKGTPNSGNGSPCAQVETTESLTLKPGAAIGGRLFTKVQLDLEMTGNAVVLASFRNGTGTPEVYTLQTGTSITTDQLAETDNDFSAPYVVSSSAGDQIDACAAPSNSGPNNAGNDNCEWQIDPSFDFDTLTLTVAVGTASLEGGGDFQNDPAHDSLFFFANTAPTAVDDTVAAQEDTPVTFDVLTNDSDPDGDSIEVQSNTTTTHGSLTRVGGVFTYTPAAEYSGPDSFTYVVTDGNGTSQATVTINVAAVNDAPVAISGPATTDEDTTSAPILVATDIDSSILSADCTTTEDGATVVDLGDGRIAFTPPPDFNGEVTITCDVADDQGAHSIAVAVVTVTVTPVNDAPVAVDDVASVDQELSIVIDVLSNDSDVDAGSSLVVTNLTGPSHGTVALVAGGVRYTPTPGYSGDDSFTYTANDGQADSNVATVDVAVCTVGTVTDADGDVSGTFTPITTEHGCKQYAVDAVQADGSVLFTPSGAEQIAYRGYLSLGAKPAALGLADPNGEKAFNLRYDPTGGTTFQPVQWCINPQFAVNGDVVSATLPSGESWCVASDSSRGDINGDVVTTWQVYGVDDPRFQ